MIEAPSSPLPKQFRPLLPKDRVLIKVDDGVTVTEGGIHLVQEKKEARATVLAWGPECPPTINGIPSFSQGVRIIFGMYAGTDVKINNTQYRIIRYEDILVFLLE